MGSLLSIFSIAFLSLSVMFMVLTFKESTFKVKHIAQIENITMLTKIPGIALSTSFLENRITFYEDNANNIYLNMDSNRLTDFVYGK